MLRNDLITLLAQYDNDPVTVSINGCAVEVEGVAVENGSLTIVLDDDELQAAASTVTGVAMPLADDPDVTP